MHTSGLLVSLSLLASTALGQTWTDCNPLNRTDCPNDIALGIANYSIDLRKQTMDKDVWNITNGEIDYDNESGAMFTIRREMESPTIQSNFHILFGQVEVIMLAAPGQGIVSSIVIQSADLDEIDWEWIGGNNTHVQTNYFGKGNTTSYDRALWHEVETPQTLYHNYTIAWEAEKTDFYIDDKVIRTLKFEDANGGKNYPQTPSDVRLGIWPGGDPSNNEHIVEWSGGEVDYDDAPFEMAVKSIRVRDAHSATEYRWGDKTGSMESIEVINGTRRAFSLDGNNNESTVMSASKRWKALSKTAQIAIISSVAGVVVIAIAAMAFFCIRQRRVGKHERAVADAEFEKGASELLAFRAEMNRQRTVKAQNSKRAFSGHGYQKF